MDKIRIIEYSKEYQEEIIELILSIQRSEFNVSITKEDQPDLKDIENFYQTKNGNFWIAIYHNQVIGTISLVDIGNGQGALRKMFVKSSFRGKDYQTGKLLLQHLITWSKAHDIFEIYLGTTEKFLAAHRFYEKNNFIQICREALPGAFPVMKVDTRFYQIEI
jgi:GNAT superfamily N-acetyltransferase